MAFEFKAGAPHSADDGEEDDYTSERILMDKADPCTPEEKRLYKVRWKGFAASRKSWAFPSSFVPTYTTARLNCFNKKGMSAHVKDVLVH